ncbi:MAG: HAD-IIIA family hydrolase [Phycisphaerae bacterium]|jgi:D-glycero-D-manno-heptose 1,7-bisphosphate phosphatase
MSNKAIFLDRDDTIIEDPGYINSPDQVKLLQFASSAVADFRKMGYKLVVISNQSGIARGIITEQALGQIHEKLKQLLAEQNAYLDRIYYCPYHPDGVIQKYRKDSDWRKPKPGMLLAAAKEMNLNLSDSWMVGNTYQDVAAGKAAGCRTILIKQSLKIPVKKQGDQDADFEAVNLREAVNIIKRETMPKPVVAAAVPAPTPVTAPSAPPVAVLSPATNPVVVSQPIIVEPEPVLKPVAVPEPIKVKQAVVVERPAEKEIVPQPLEEEEKEQMEEPKAVETIEKKPQRQKPVDNVEFKVPAGDSSKTEKLLEEIRLLMKSRNRQELYTEFSVFKLFAGFMQIVAAACVFIAIRYKMSLTPADSAVYTSLGFAIFFQIMTLTLYVMHKDK